MDGTELDNMIVRLTGDGTEYASMLNESVSATKEAADRIVDGLKKTEDAARSSGDALKSLAGTAKVAIVALAAGLFGKESFAAFSESEEAIINLNSTLKANGRDVEQLSERYQKFANDMINVTGISDETTLGNLRMAESFGLTGKAAEKAVQDAIGLADSAGTSAEAMIRLTAAMAQGDLKRAMMFSRMVPQLRGVKNEQEFLSKYQKLTEAGFEAVGLKAQTASGKMRILKETFGNLMEEFGGIVAEGIKPVIDGLIEAVRWFQSLGLTKSILESVGAAWAVIKEKGMAAWQWLEPIRDAIVSLGKEIWRQLVGIWDQVTTAAVTAWDTIFGGTNWEEWRDKAQDAILAVEFMIGNFGQVMEVLWTQFKLGNVRTWNSLVDAAQQAFDYIGDNWKDLMMAMVKAQLAVINRIISTFAQTPSLIQDAIQGKNDTFRQIWSGVGEDIKKALGEVKPFELKKREIGPTEQALEEEYKRLKGALDQDFAEWKAQKLQEFAEAHQEIGAPPMPEEDGADNMMKTAASEEAKGRDAAKARSAEANVRLQEARRIGDPASKKQDKMISLLGDIKNNTKPGNGAKLGFAELEAG